MKTFHQELIHPNRVLIVTCGTLSDIIIATSVIETVYSINPNLQLALALPKIYQTLFQNDHRVQYFFPLNGNFSKPSNWNAPSLASVLQFAPDWIIGVHKPTFRLLITFWDAIKIGLFHANHTKNIYAYQLDYLFSLENYKNNALPSPFTDKFSFQPPNLILSNKEFSNAQSSWCNDKTHKILLAPINERKTHEWIELHRYLLDRGYNAVLLTNSDISKFQLDLPIQRHLVKVVSVEEQLPIILALIATSNLCITTSNGLASFSTMKGIPVLKWNRTEFTNWYNQSLMDDLSTFVTFPPNVQSIMEWILHKISFTS
ncbi:MAG: hypothetical protein N2450_05500 [bacterium]|nr:hypothetical protein [bacterium]